MNKVTFKILVAEDDEDDRFIMDEAFRSIKYEGEIKKFKDGVYLMDYLQKVESTQLPALILLDNSLPKVDTMELLTWLKQNSACQHIPVIVYGAGILPERKSQLLAKGAIACLNKGTDIQDVHELATLLKEIAERIQPVNNQV
jgi:CheY-like chemotaxis protein